MNNTHPWKIDETTHPDSKRQVKTKLRDKAIRQSRLIKNVAIIRSTHLLANPSFIEYIAKLG